MEHEKFEEFRTKFISLKGQMNDLIKEYNIKDVKKNVSFYIQDDKICCFFNAELLG
jgi:hypothetical protein